MNATNLLNLKALACGTAALALSAAFAWSVEVASGLTVSTVMTRWAQRGPIAQVMEVIPDRSGRTRLAQSARGVLLD